MYPRVTRRVKSARDLDREPQRLLETQRPVPEPLGQRLTLEVLHHEEVDAILVADVVEGADVRVICSSDVNVSLKARETGS